MSGLSLLYGKTGVPERTRTSDARFRKPTLYPLSYGDATDKILARLNALHDYHFLLFRDPMMNKMINMPAVTCYDETSADMILRLYPTILQDLFEIFSGCTINVSNQKSR